MFHLINGVSYIYTFGGFSLYIYVSCRVLYIKRDMCAPSSPYASSISNPVEVCCVM